MNFFGKWKKKKNFWNIKPRHLSQCFYSNPNVIYHSRKQSKLLLSRQIKSYWKISELLCSPWALTAQNLYSDPTFIFKVIYKFTKSVAFPAFNSNIPKLSAPFIGIQTAATIEINTQNSANRNYYQSKPITSLVWKWKTVTYLAKQFNQLTDVLHNTACSTQSFFPRTSGK